MLWIGGLSERGHLPCFSTPLSTEIIEAPCPKKVKMPSPKPSIELLITMIIWMSVRHKYMYRMWMMLVVAATF